MIGSGSVQVNYSSSGNGGWCRSARHDYLRAEGHAFKVALSRAGSTWRAERRHPPMSAVEMTVRFRYVCPAARSLRE